MDRREFLKAASMASLSYLLPEFGAWAANSGTEKNNGNKLVVVFLRGALDGLSAVVPYGDDKYYSVRNKIAIPKPGTAGGAIALDSNFGLHPVLEPLMPFWKSKNLAFVLNSGSPDPTRSHFDAQDYMESGMPGTKVCSTGWLDRLLTQLPNNGSPVRAINIGATTPRILQGPVAPATYAPSKNRRMTAMDHEEIATEFRQMYMGRKDELEKAFEAGLEARATISSALNSSSDMQQEMQAANGGAIPANKFGGFGRQLGRLINQEPAVQVAFVALGGFDTHVNQGSDKGALANQLTVLGKGLSELATGLGPSFDKTTIMVMSEFGRTVKENGNGGTDHGHGNAIWLLGGKVNGGKLYGKWNGVAQNELYEGRDLPVTTDFRSVVGSIVGEHLHLSQAQLDSIFPNFKIGDKSLADIMKA